MLRNCIGSASAAHLAFAALGILMFFGEVARGAEPPAPSLAEAGRLLEFGKGLEALAVLNRLEGIDGPSAEISASRARAYSGLGKLDLALSDAEEAVQLDDKSANAYASRSGVRRLLGKIEEAVADAETAVRLDPKSARALVNRGQAFLLSGKETEAAADFEAANKLDPRLAVVYQVRISLLVKKKKFDEALAECDRLLQVRPDHAFGARLSRSFVLQNQSKLDEALKELQALTKEDPKSAIAARRLGDVHQAKGNLAAAISAYDAAVRLDEKNVPNLLARAEAYRRHGRLVEALADFDAVLNIDPKNDTGRRFRSFTLSQMGRATESIADLDYLLKLNPKNANALIERGRRQSELRDFAKAEEDYTAFLEITPKSTDAYASRAAARLALGKLDEAWSDTEAAAAIAPPNAYLRVNRGDILQRQAKFDEALEEFRLATVADPKYAFAYRRLGDLRTARNELSAAVKAFDEAIRLEDKNPTHRLARADALRRSGRADDALADYDAVIKVDEKNDTALRYRSFIRRQLGRFDEALADLDVLLKLNPKDIGALLDRADTFAAQQKFAAADDAYSAVLLIAPRSADALARRAAVRMSLKKFDAAWEDTEAAIKIDPKHPTVYVTRGDILWSGPDAGAKLGQIIAEYTQAIKIAPQTAHAYYQRAFVYIFLNRLAEARSDIDAALKIAPGDSRSWYQRAMISMTERKYPEAIADLNESIRLFPGGAIAYSIRAEAQRAVGNSAASELDLAMVAKLDPKLLTRDPFAPHLVTMQTRAPEKDEIVLEGLYRDGKLSEASEFLEKQLAFRQQDKGATPQEISDNLNDLFEAKLRLGEFDAARKIVDERATFEATNFGPTHDRSLVAIADRKAIDAVAALSPAERDRFRDVARQLAQMRTLQKAERNEEALAIAEKVAKFYETTFGPKSLRFAFSQLDVARCLQDLTRYEEAESSYREVAELLNELFGPNYAFTRVVKRNQALSRFSKVFAETKKSRASLEAALAIVELDRAEMKFFEADPKASAAERSAIRRAFLHTSAWMSCELAEQLDEYKKALPLRKECVGIATKEYGAADWRTVDARLAAEFCDVMARWTPEQLKRSKEFLDSTDVQKLYSERRYSDAIAAQRKIVDCWKELVGEKHVRYAEALRNLADLYEYSAGDEKEIEAHYLACLGIRREVLGDAHPEVMKTLRALGRSRSRRQDFVGADLAFRQAVEIARLAYGVESSEYADALVDAVAAGDRVRPAAMSEAMLTQIAEIRRKRSGDNSLAYAESLVALAANYQTTGQRRTAQRLYVTAIRLFRELRTTSKLQLPVALGRDAKLKLELGDVAGARAGFTEAAESCERSFALDDPLVLQSLLDLGRFFEETDDLTTAERHFRRGLDLAAKASHDEYRVWFLARLGDLRMKIADYVEARRFYEESLEICSRKFGDQDIRTAHSMRWVARACFQLNDAQRFIDLHNRSYEVFKNKLGPLHEQTTEALEETILFMSSIGAIEPEKSIPILEKVLGDLIRRHGPAHYKVLNQRRHLSQVYWKQKDFVRAHAQTDIALAMLISLAGERHSEVAVARHGKALIQFSQGDVAAAADSCAEALAILQPYLEAAAGGQSERQQLAMTQDSRRVLDLYLSAATALADRRQSAYAAMLQWKGMVWVRQRLQRAAAARPELMPTFRELQSVTQELAQRSMAPVDGEDAKHAMNRLAERKEQLERDLSARSEDFRRSRKPITLQDLRAVLDADTALVDFLEFDRTVPVVDDGVKVGTTVRHLLAVIVKSQGELKFVDLGKMAPIATAIDTWRETMGSGEQGKAAGQTLRKAIWEPIEAQLGTAKTVLVSPDGALGKLPLAALPGAKPDTFLIEERAIVVIPVPQALPALLEDQTDARKREMRDLLIVGDVDYGREVAAPPEAHASAAAPRKGINRIKDRSADWKAFDPLDGTATEIAAIGKLFLDDKDGAFKVTTLDKDGAREERFTEEAPRHRYIHAATHGFFAPPSLVSALAANSSSSTRGAGGLAGVPARDADVPPGLLSGLALTGANRDADSGGADGILTAEEVETLDLSGVEMAVLSACESGLGRVAGGEGVLGLQRAFQVAGTRTTITSLWKVDDAQTQVLMVRMYRNLLAEGMGTFEALREAQLWMLKEGPRRDSRIKSPDAKAEQEPKRSPPYYWAPFVLSGDWR